MKPIDGAMLNVAQRLNAGAGSRVTRADATRAVGGDAGAAASNRSQAAAPLAAGPSAPIDGDRVAVIRKAVEQGKYPVVPTRIADAMIAAGYLLRTRK